MVPKPFLELQTGFTRRFRERLDAAVIEISTAIEGDIGDAGGLGALGDQLANFGGSLAVGTGLQRATQAGFQRRGSGNSHTLHVVDDLGVDVARGTMDA